MIPLSAGPRRRKPPIFDGYRVVAGNHRLTAVKQFRREEIEAIVIESDDGALL